MKTKQSIWKNKLAKTTILATTLVVVFTMIFGSAATAIQNVSLRNEIDQNTLPMTEMQLSLGVDKTPYTSTGPAPQSNAIWDLQLNVDVDTLTGSVYAAGAECDGTYLYISEFSSSAPYGFYKFTLAGGFVGGFSISGAGLIRDLAYDGQYMYGGAGSTTIYKMDFTSGTLVGTQTSPVAVRAIAYDPVFDAFWVSDWTTAITLVSRAGVALQTIPNPSVCAGKYGLAYDANTPGGPFLWIFDQTTGATNTIYQMLISSGTLTGVSHNCDPDLGNAGMAGGLFATDAIVAGKFSVGGLSQGTPDKLFAYEISDVIPKDHDVAVTSIDAPVAGTATASIVPKATVKNLGIYTENFNVSLKIYEELTGQVNLWSEGFENWVPMVLGTMPPGGWGIQNKNGYNTWLRDFSKANSRSGYYNAYIRNDTTQNSDVLYVKPIYIPVNNLSYSFYYKVWLNGAPETFKIGYWTGIEPDWIWVDQVTTNVGTTWTKYTWNIPTNLTGSTVYFAINYTSFDWYGMRLDDFTLPDGSTEGFEDTMGYFTSPSTNWITVQTGGTNYNNYWLEATAASAVMYDHNPLVGTQMAWFDIRGRCQSPDASRLQMTTPMNLASYNQELLVLDFYLFQTNLGSSYQDKVALDISTDNGATWKQLGEWRQYDSTVTTPAWKQKSVSLAGYEDAASVLFGFRASAGSSSASGYDITIDNVTINAIPINVLVNEVKPVVGLAPGASTQVLFSTWNVPGWQSGLPQYVNNNVKYNVKVKTLLPTDVYAKNNVSRSSPLLYYPYDHDVGITAITQPSTGPGGVSIPVSYTIKNFGQFPENGAANWFFSNISIDYLPSLVSINRDFSDCYAVDETWGLGWTEKKVTGTSTYDWSCKATSTSPTCTPKVGALMAYYDGYNAASGSQDRLYSPQIDFSNKFDFRLKFWMYHDAGYTTYNGNIVWQYSLDNGTTWSDFSGGKFYRSITMQGVPSAGWYEWKVDMSPVFNTSNVRIGMLATSDYWGRINIDDVRVYYMSNSTNIMQNGFEIYTPKGFALPPDFTVVRKDPLETWKVYGTTPSTFRATCTEVGSVGAQNEWLITPTFSTGATPWLSFDRQLYTGTGPDSWLTAFYSLNNGTTWTEIVNFTTTTAYGTYNTLQPFANQPFVTLGFRFMSKLDTSKYDYAYLDNIRVSDKSIIQEYMVPYVPPVVLNPGDSVTVSPINWNPAAQPSGAHNYRARANTFLTSDTNLANNAMTKDFTLTTGHDLAVTAITQPNVAWIAGAAQPVIATIKNLGTYTESKTATATITDLGSSTVVYTSTYNIVSLTSGTEITATFDPFTPTTSGNYKLRVEVPADDVAANDYKEFSFGVDLVAPVSMHTLNPGSPNGQNNWYVSDVIVTLSSTDTGCGVDAIYYKIGTGTWNEYSSAITLSADGSYDIKYYAVDNLGNIEAEKTIPTIKIDKTAPTIVLSVNALNAMKTKWLLSTSVSDATSGIAKVEFYVADALVGTVTAAPWEYIYEGTDGPCQAIVYDNAGNSAVSEKVASFSSELTNNLQQTRPLVNNNGI